MIVRDGGIFLHKSHRDRGTKFRDSFRQTPQSSGVEPLRLRVLSSHWNAFAERWVKSVKDECFSKLTFFGEDSLRHALGSAAK
ncbi:MAG: putative transposase [Gammaproteobacteria bacterium]|jgi:putative transposase